MKLAVRTLTDSGVQEFLKYLHQLGSEPSTPVPHGLLTDTSFSAGIQPIADVDSEVQFSDKLAFGTYLAQALRPVRRKPEFDSHVGLWSWLGLCFFDVICPPEAGGLRHPKAVNRYVFSTDYRHSYRHLIRTPCMLAEMHGIYASALLMGTPSTLGEATEQIFAREYLRNNKALFEVIDRLYVNRVRGNTPTMKRGASGKDSPGTVRRLGKVVRQFDRTFDLYGMTADEMFMLLPPEFARFKKAKAAEKP